MSSSSKIFVVVCALAMIAMVTVEAQQTVGEGEECNPTVSPEFQILCQDGLECVVPPGPGLGYRVGANGICTAPTPSPAPAPSPTPSGPTEVGEGEECNGTLSPEFQTVCAPGLECVVPPGPGLGYRVGATGICTAPTPSPSDCLSVAETAIATPDLSSLVAALQAVDLADDLSDKALSETFLAPTNDAFEELLTALSLTFTELAAQPELLSAVLLYHALPVGPVFSSQLEDGATIPTLNPDNATLTVDLSDGVTFVGVGSSANVIQADIEACESVIHVIDQVLLPVDLLPAAPEPDAPATGDGVAFGPCTVGADCASGICFGDIETSFFFLFDFFRSCSP